MTSQSLHKALARFAAMVILGILLAACAEAPKSEAPTPLPQPSVAPAAEFTSAPTPTGSPSERGSKPASS
jgi:hypothetical protein